MINLSKSAQIIKPSRRGTDPMPEILVCGPAYLDRVLRIDQPLVDPRDGPPVDASVEGELRAGGGLKLVDRMGGEILIELPEGWPGPEGVCMISRPLIAGQSAWNRRVR